MCCGSPPHDRKVRHHAQHQRPRLSDPGRAAPHAGGCHSRRLRPDRDPYRLRARHLRCLHHHPRRRRRARLPDVRDPGRRPKNPHRRGARRRRYAASDPAGLHRPSRPAMRLLHAGLPDARGQRAGAPDRHRRRRVARRARLQPVPLHRLPEHHQGGARRRRGDAQGGDVTSDVTGYPVPPRSDERRVLGHPVPRIEDRPLVTGRGLFAGDVAFTHQLHMRVVRSGVAHGRIVHIDASAALRLPGVAAVWTSADIPDVPPIDFRDASRAADEIKPYRQPALAQRRVRYVGDPVAAVFAEDPYVAEDAADLVEVGIEALPVIVSASDPPGEFDDGRSTAPLTVRHSYGDIDAAFAAAHAVIELDLSIGRHSGVPLETRGAIGFYDAARDVLELHGAAKVPHRNKDTLVRMLGLMPAQIHLHEGHTGGGFGVRGELYPEDVLVLVAAKRFGRPVKWIEDRRENLIATNHSRQQRHRIRAAVDKDGRLIGIDDEFFHDQGAYVRTHGASVVGRTMSMLTGAYKVGAYRAAGHFRLTNKTPAATYRAPGRFEGSFVRERVMDAIAAKLGIDRVALRRANLVPAAEMPYTITFNEKGAEELPLDSGDFLALFDKALAHFRWREVEAAAKARRAAGELVGTGVAFFLEEAGRGPRDGAQISVDSSGAVEVVTGGASVGQGFETAMAQICAEALGVDYRRIRVVHGQTDRIAHGIGAHAARATVLTGSAVHATAVKLRGLALGYAAELLQTPASDLDIIDGVVRKSGMPGGPLH